MPTEPPFPLTQVLDEFTGVDLGDARRDQRLQRIVQQVAREPSRSFPQAWVTVADTEAGYRFVRNRRVSADAILEPHRRATLDRAAKSDWLLSLEDTTEMRFGGAKKRKGLGSLMNGGQGFYLHGALLASLGDSAERAMPLGLVAHEIVVRSDEPKPKRKWRDAYDDPNKESLRWNRLVAAVEQSARARELSVVHVADREASRFDLLAEIAKQNGRFIVRLRSGFLDRADVFEEQRGQLERVADIAERLLRAGGRRKANQPREARIAHLEFHARRVRLHRPQHVSPSLGEHMDLQVVEVSERDVPLGTTPISWTLVTTESVETTADVARVVDAYRSRWLIEEYWKSLKTGCSFESRQLEGLDTLVRALAVCIPIAWHMLLMRNISRDTPRAPAAGLLSPLMYELLIALSHPSMNRWGFKLSAEPTAGELLLAVARIGGHLPNNGAPGFITIRRGLDTLYELEAGIALLKDTM